MSDRPSRDAQWWRDHLDGVVGRAQDFKAICPSHPDESPSLHVTGRVGKDALVKCFAGCKYADVLGAVEAAPAERPIAVRIRPMNGHAPATRYEIRDATGLLRATHVRTDRGAGKVMAWEGGLRGLRPEDLPLYASQLIPAWPADEMIVVTEGEKAAQALLGAGFHALGTVTGASSAPSLAALGPLLGRPTVLWPDADDVGLAHMARIAASLAAHGGRAAWVTNPDGARKGWDAADAVAELTPTEVEALIRSAGEPPVEEKASTALEFTWAADTDDVEQPPLILGFLEPGESTMLFGAGGTGKGIIASWWIAQLTQMGEVVMILDYERHFNYEWKPRIKAFGGDPRQWGIVQPPVKAIWDDEDELIRLADHHGATIVVVDSVGYACLGEEIETSRIAIQYQATMSKFNRTSLNLSHTAAADVDAKKAFGSSYWGNGSRQGISVREDPKDPLLRILTNTKTNSRPKFPPVELDWSWSPSGVLPATLTSRPVSTQIVPGALQARDVRRLRILEILMDGPQTANDLADILGANRGTVTADLRAHIAAELIVKVEGIHAYAPATYRLL